MQDLLDVLIALLTVVCAARLGGALFATLQQPRILGAMLAGILLGPSLLGRAPAVAAVLLPGTARPMLGVVAEVGIVVFMFLVGLELDGGQLRRHTRVSIAVSNASIGAPLALGAALALWLQPQLAPDVATLPFASFFAVSMSVTAFPVLARILAERGLQRSALGTIALTSAAANDVAAWCLLALVVGVVRSAAGAAAWTVAAALAFVAVMVVLVRPRLASWVQRPAAMASGRVWTLSVVGAGLLLTVATTAALGLHAMFGAFLFGALIPAGSPLAQTLVGRLGGPVAALLLPVYFAFTGLRTELALVHGLRDWLLCASIVAVATLAKFGGSYAAARWAGLGWRPAAAVGALMNTRGLMELVVLNVGVDLQVVPPRLFAMMVFMAIVTTLMTAPALQLLGIGSGRSRAGGDDDGARDTPAAP